MSLLPPFLAIGTYDPTGGLKTVTDSFISSFREQGWPCTWLLFGTQTPPTLPKHADVHYLQLHDPWAFYADDAQIEPLIREAVASHILKEKPAFLFRSLEYAFEPYLRQINLPSITLLHLLNRPLIHSTQHQPFHQEERFRSSLNADRIRARHEKAALGRSAALIANSQTTARDLGTHYPEFADRLAATSAPGARPIFFKVPPPDFQRRVLFFGRLAPQKGIYHLLQPVPPSWHFIVAGRGKWAPSEFVKIGAHPIDWTEETQLVDLVGDCTFCVFPSHYEPWGLSLNEALAAGRICLVQSGAGGHEEQIVHGENGFLFDFRAGSFWKELERILALGPVALCKISHQAQKNARPWSRHLSEVQAALEEFAGTLARLSNKP